MSKRCAHKQNLAAWLAIALLAGLMFHPSRLAAQASDAEQQNQPATVGPELNPNLQPPSTTQPPAAPASTSNAPAATDSQTDPNSYQQTPVTNLETGLPLRSVMSPLHWGHLSLLSFTAFEGYSTNYQMQASASGSGLTALQALAIYSIQRQKTSFNLQYEPYVWFTPNTTYKNFAANSVDLDTTHNFGRAWMLTLADSFRYSPQQANSLGGAYSADFGSATSSSNPFLALGRRYWTNSANIDLDDRLSERSHLTFNATDNFVRISTQGEGGLVSTSLPGLTQENIYGGGVAWTRDWSKRNILRLSYNYRRQEMPAGFGNANYHLLDVSYSHVLRPTLTVTVQGGPGFWSGTGFGSYGNYRRTTAQGSLALFKAFRNGGGIAISANRDASYSGIISNSLNNRYNVSLSRGFLRRWNFTATGSYVQQEFVGRPTTNGELVSGQIDYRIARMWSIFGGYRYFHSDAQVLNFAPLQFASVGIRWAWETEK